MKPLLRLLPFLVLLALTQCKTPTTSEVNPSQFRPAALTIRAVTEDTLSIEWQRGKDDKAVDTVVMVSTYSGSAVVSKVAAPGSSLLVTDPVLVFGGFTVQLSAGDTTLSATHTTAKPRHAIGAHLEDIPQQFQTLIQWSRGAHDVFNDTVFLINGSTPQLLGIVLAPQNSLLVSQLSIPSMKVRIACWGSDTTIPAIPAVTFTPPTNLAATSGWSSNVILRWDRDPLDGSADTVTARDQAGNLIRRFSVQSGSILAVDGLALNKEYTFTVSNAAGASSIKYARAIRNGPLRLWETADNTAGHYAGLILHDPTILGARSGNTRGADSLNVDVVLTSDPSNAELPFMSIRSADVTGTGIQANARSTRFSNSTMLIKGGMDSLYFASQDAVISQLSGTANNWDITTMQSPSSKFSAVMLLKTADDHFAELEIVPQSNGQLYGEDNTPNHNRFVDVRVSYQPSLGWGYVGRPHPITNSGGVKKVNAGTATMSKAHSLK